MPVPKIVHAGRARPAVLIVIGFLGFWLVGWTAGIVFAIVTLVQSSDDSPFMLAWLGFAVVSWLFGVWILATLVRAIRSLPRKPGRGPGLPRAAG